MGMHSAQPPAQDRRPRRHQASLNIRLRLAAADPANTGWWRDLSVTRQKFDDLCRSAEEA